MRNVLVTGHSKGIGFAITEALLENNNTVIGAARTKIEERARLAQFSVDFSHPDNTELFAKELARRSQNSSDEKNQIDAVICNAGSGQFGALENFSNAHIQNSIQLNLVSPLVLLRTLLPILKQRKRSDIIFIASESAIQGGRYGSVYSAAKFGLRGAAQSLRYECASANCHVGIINPGMVRTGFFDGLNFEPGNAEQHALQAKDVAQSVLSILNSPDNAVIEEINVSPLQHVVQKKPQ